MQPDKIDKIETMIYHENLQETNHTIVHPGNDHLFDLSGLEEMDDNEYLVEIVTIFLNETPGELREIREALAAGKTELIFKKAHKLKSSAGVLQADARMGTAGAQDRPAGERRREAGSHGGEIMRVGG